MKIGRLLAGLILVSGIVLFREPISGYFNYFEEKLKLGKFVSELPKVRQSDLDAIVGQIEKQVQAPPPLRAREEVSESFLTRSGVIEWTNIQRNSNGGFAALKESVKLDLAASVKLKDMFNNQYFEHISPTGMGPAEVVKGAGYEFILVGENLALGNFKDDKTLVQAWMDSPGHRANILNNRFTEIGVAVGKGTFEGRTTWLAVQEFGLPLSFCPGPSSVLKSGIETLEAQAGDLSEMIYLKRAEIENTRPKRGEAYNQKIDEYNELVNEYNALVEQIKVLIADYNNQVKSLNDCVQGEGS